MYQKVILFFLLSAINRYEYVLQGEYLIVFAVFWLNFVIYFRSYPKFFPHIIYLSFENIALIPGYELLHVGAEKFILDSRLVRV